jgi:hypothetical protein
LLDQFTRACGCRCVEVVTPAHAKACDNIFRNALYANQIAGEKKSAQPKQQRFTCSWA